MGFADEAYEIDGDGHLIPTDTSAVSSSDLPQDEEESVDTPGVNETTVLETVSVKDGGKVAETRSVNSAESEDTKKRDTKNETISDREVYMIYARSMGLPHAFVFLVAGIAFSVTLKLPGTSLSFRKMF